jgi:hypothetical protein
MKGRSPHLVSLLVTVCFLVVALGSTKKSDTPKGDAGGAKTDAEAEERAAILDYYAKLAAVHTGISSLDMQSLSESSCDPADVKSRVDNDKDALRVRTVYGPFLARFAADKSAWSKDESGWAWMTDGVFGRFDEHADDKPGYQLITLANDIRKLLLKRPYLLVIEPLDESQNKMPVWLGNKEYTAGYFSGWAFLVDSRDAAILCQWRLEAKTSERISYRSGGRRLGRLLKQDPKKVLRDDFEDSLEKALERGMPKGVYLATGFGGILK